ncbi:hypothetical protein GGR58DRAFT_520754 [Xylaria digitata]|nr:hypothetical protein GGR58DRAFT_520754 [Xylaria digitata]
MPYRCLIYIASFILLRVISIFFYADISVIPLLGPLNELRNIKWEPSWREVSIEGINSQIGCSYLLTDTPNKPPLAYDLLTKVEISMLKGAISKARQSSREIREAGLFWPRKAAQMSDLDEVLSHIVIGPLRSFCEALSELLQEFPQQINSESDATEARRLLLRTLWKLSQGGLVGGSTDGARISGLEVSLGAERAFKWVLEDLDDSYCVGGDCSWPLRIFNMWQHTEDVRAALKKRLFEVKTQVPPNQKRSLDSIFNEMAVLLPAYVIDIIAGNVLARRL